MLTHNVLTILKRWDIQIIWQTGKMHFDKIHKLIPDRKDLHIAPYITNMTAAYSASDLIISRAGALSLAELQKIGLPAILIPLPTAAANHQYHNAKSLEAKGCVKVITDHEIHEGGVINMLQKLLENKDMLLDMKQNMKKLETPDSPKIIAQRILSDLKGISNAQ